jgi:hypothetical protein
MAVPPSLEKKNGGLAADSIWPMPEGNVTSYIYSDRNLMTRQTSPVSGTAVMSTGYLSIARIRELLRYGILQSVYALA